MKKMIEKLKNIRVALNYKKEGVTQILPILYLKNDNERALLLGLWKYNIAFVKGKNIVVLDESLNGIYDDCKKKSSYLSRLSSRDKILLCLVALGSVAILGLVVYKLKKNRKHL